MDLAQVLLFVPDVGLLLVVFADLCGVLALLRVGITVRAPRAVPGSAAGHYT
ncbi:hypothetical protein [Streptomyces alfalfae]|uniref:Uncharacterized protein n=1 Tax=Streptomyces alfalfae TaxID=1642299 RepID=A0A7T4TWY5_9ACTN|nr:hypothetical protein [Streptomyces alfalfae]QQC88128.1 hypothetical protein I8755_06670 [Streptomyces alfalfae]